jgi:hypothetical protein
VLLNTVKNLQVPLMEGNFLTSWETINFSGRTVLYEVMYEGPLKSSLTTLLLRIGTSWRCGDGLFFEVPPLKNDTLLTTLHPLLENVLQTVCRKLQEDSGTGDFDLLITLKTAARLIASSP